MTQEQFVYWLQGMLEYTDVGDLGGAEAKKKLQGIKDHLATVFKKITPTPVITTPTKTPVNDQGVPLDWLKKIDTVKKITDRPVDIRPYNPWDEEMQKYLPKYISPFDRDSNRFGPVTLYC